MTAVVVLGGSGMLGWMVADELSRSPELKITVTTRSGAPASAALGSLDHRAFDAVDGDVDALLKGFPAGSWVVNAIGVIKPHIDEADPRSRTNAITVNGTFPHRLAAAAQANGMRVVQIATDCVYSGRSGNSTESAPHDPTDVYGKTKSLGEVPSPATMHLRVSIIGPELDRHVSLLDWFRMLPPGATVTGFDNHAWNGVTTLHFARLVRGAIVHDRFRPGVFHIVPGDVVTKAELLQAMAAGFDRGDVVVNVAPAGVAIDRTLATEHADVNAALWSAAGYDGAPAIAAMVNELAAEASRW